MNDISNQDMTSAAEPAAERITLALVDRLKTIKGVSGYWQDVTVFRTSPAEAPPITHARIEVVLESEQKEDAPYSIEQIRATHWLICDVVASEKNPVAIDALLHRIKADVKKAVQSEPTLGGLAIDCVSGDAVVLDSDLGSHAGRVVVVVEAIYRTLEADPYVIFNNPA